MSKFIKKQLAVIFGGPSGEHEVSLRSADQVMRALNKNKYEIIPVAITKDGHWLIDEKGKKYLEDNVVNAEQAGGVDTDSAEKDRCKFPREFPTVDLILPIMHGPFGEDGKVQGVFEALGIPYVFSGVLASSLAMNKRKTKIIAKESGVTVARDTIVSRDKKYAIEKIIAALGLPIVIKPLELGSSVGTSLAHTEKELECGIEEAWKYGDEVLLEQFIEGRELTVTVTGDSLPKALPVIEIIPKVSDWFDYRAKYETGGSEEICPAVIPDDVRKKVQSYAIKVFTSIGCRDLARADFIWSNDDDKLYFLEINTIPGMTATSLAPQAAKAVGMEFSDFLDRIIKNALKRYESKKFDL